jgi:hypothetical protein
MTRSHYPVPPYTPELAEQVQAYADAGSVWAPYPELITQVYYNDGVNPYEPGCIIFYSTPDNPTPRSVGATPYEAEIAMFAAGIARLLAQRHIIEK